MKVGMNCEKKPKTLVHLIGVIGEELVDNSHGKNIHPRGYKSHTDREGIISKTKPNIDSPEEETLCASNQGTSVSKGS